MSDFSTSQTQLTQARTALTDALAAAAQATEQRKRLQRARDALARRLDPNDPATLEEDRRLAGLLDEAEKDLQAAQASVAHAREGAVAAVSGFATFSDPRRNVTQLSDRWPFVLLPIRIETRFATLTDEASTPGAQLWVRIYPDECSVDTFEPTLSGAELANAQRYWEMVWSAGGIEADDRAAWRRLVTAHGSGRAGWIVDHYQPLNLGDRPTRAAATDEVLVIPTQTALSAAEATAVATYWRSSWLADDNASAQHTARTRLDTAVGAARATQLIADYRPYNFSDAPTKPLQKADVAVSTAFVVFPADPPTKQNPWTQAPRVNTLADRFVVLGFIGGTLAIEAIGGLVSLPLIVGPDPSAPPEDTIHPQNGDLFVPDELQWLVDFDRAVAAGMGLRIDVTPEQARTGFDRLLVLGLQLSSNAADGQAALEKLLQHHYSGRSGLSLTEQGTPTHNTSAGASGESFVDDPDATFDDRRQASLFTPTQDPLSKRDGQWLAELLGVDPNIFIHVHNAGGADQMQARAMQRALWPATVGYWMDKMMTPVFSDDAIENTRWFFTNYVSGRGAVPAVRIGGQPYGILPTTAFSRIAWLDERPQRLLGLSNQRAFLARLLALLRAIDTDWTAMAQGAAFVDKPGDAHQILLDILGLHPASIEFYSRYAESFTQLFNTLNLGGFGPDWWQAIIALALQQAGIGLLSNLGYTGAAQPDILQHVFLREAERILTLIDDRPLSETMPIREYTDDHLNYVDWLVNAARTSLDAVTQEQGFSGNQTPEALLYLMLRHALMLGYYDTSYNLHRSAGFLTPQALQAMKPEPVFVHVGEGQTSESRFAALYKTEARITSNPTLTVADYISRNLTVLIESAHLAEQINGMEVLAKASTASLERVFAEHIDCCTYRFDAWLLGLVALQLENMRYIHDGEVASTLSGAYIGAYGWVENLRPAPTLRLAELPADLAKVYAGGAPIMRDPANGGYIHAPSMAHARTAAVLRSGYLANATQADPGIMNVNVSSDRVRLALSMLEGIRNGQTLGALLGYGFERALHDDYVFAEVDQFIFPLRKAFPLAGDALSTTQTDSGVPIEAIEARNVLDGLKLVNHIRTTNNANYPFGITTLPPVTAQSQADAIDAEARHMLDAYDAIGDLALAEGVHQAVQGNFERISATLEAYSSGHFPPEPEVVQTPPSGISLTHRVAVHLQPGLPTTANPTPRSTAEPAVDAWLASILPPLNGVGCRVSWTDPASAAARTHPVSLSDLNLHWLDLIGLIKADGSQAMTELDDRVIRVVVAGAAPRPDATLRIDYLDNGGADSSIFQVAPMVRSLRALLTGTRPLRATDALLHGDASTDQDALVSVERARIAGPKSDLDTLSADFGTLLGALTPLLVDTPANRAALLAGLDGFIDTAIDLLARGADFSLPQSGWGFLEAWKHTVFNDLLSEIRALVQRWDARLSEYTLQITAYDALPPATPDDARFTALQAAELLLTPTPDPLPATPDLLRAALDGKHTALVTRRNQFRSILDSSVTSFATLLGNVEALLPIAALDLQALDVTVYVDRAFSFGQQLATNLQGHLKDVDSCRQSVQTQLDAHDASASAAGKLQALTVAASTLFGSEFKLVPEFELSPVQADEWANAVSAGSSGDLFQYLTATAGIEFPVDEWLHGVARVRPNMRAWEMTVLLAGPFGRLEPSLTPMQLPYVAGAPWLALQYPPDYALDGDRLLYSAQYVTPFDKTARQCGLLIDEWNEVIPASDVTTGISFNYDRPNSEPPQSILLVTPATASGAWQWDDLVGALNETLDLAKKRALEPVQIDNTPYSRFLPATISAATTFGISISLSLAAANGVFRSLEVAQHA
jgi:hypothetical protein